MKAETDKLLGIHEPVIGSHSAKNAWRVVLPLTIVTLAIIILVHWRTVESIVAIWSRSETFQHGFLIVPISLFLIWRRRRHVARLVPSPDALGLLLLAGAGLAWLAADAAQVLVVSQYALVAMIVSAVIATVGRSVSRALAFPLGFLLLGVPVGEVLIPPLMNWTADFVVAALQVSGIPVYREGNFFMIPSGQWSVVEGCSGLRYLIASVTVGILYAYLTYKQSWKRALFVVLSVVVPIIANGLRAFMIVMIAHLSDMRLALGIDHFIYGWLFFGLVMLLLFWAGAFWRDREEEAPASPDISSPAARMTTVGKAAPALAAIAAVAIASGGPLYAAYLDRARAANAISTLAVPATASGWTAEAIELTDWRPHYSGAAASLFKVYRKGDSAVALYLGYYRNQRQGAELVASTNVMVPQKHPVWGNVGESYRREDFGRGVVDVRQTLLRSARQRLVIWDWVRVSGRDLSNPYAAKLLLAYDKLLGRGDNSAAVIIAVPYEEQPEIAEEILRRFVREMLPSIDVALAQAAATVNSAK